MLLQGNIHTKVLNIHKQTLIYQELKTKIGRKMKVEHGCSLKMASPLLEP